MKIAVIAANGKEGKLVVEEALRRGHDVTAVVRGENRSAATQAIVKDILDLAREDLAGFDAVVDAFGAWAPDTLDQHTKTSQHLCDILAGNDTRLLVVGGAGSLYMNPEHTTQLLETPEFPAEYVPLASAQRDGLDALRSRDDVRWTFVSPAADFQAEGARTGAYLLAGEEFTTNDKGESAISYADYAVALIDEIEQGSHIQQRISVLGK